MTGTFEYERGDKRAVPDFNVFFRYYATYPFYCDAIWYLTQMRRWGQIGESEARRVVRRHARKRVYRPDVYLQGREAARRRRQGAASRTSRGRAMAIARRKPSSSTASCTTATSRTRTSESSRSA